MSSPGCVPGRCGDQTIRTRNARNSKNADSPDAAADAVVRRLWTEIRRGSSVGLLVGSVALLACTTLDVTPPVGAPGSAAPVETIPGRLECQGPSEYCPKRIAATENAELRFVYTVEVTYSSRETPAAIVLFNPLTLFGFPSGSTQVDAHAELEVRKDGDAVRTYTADASVRRRDNLYGQATLSDLRKRALIAARDSIDSQLARDLNELSATLP